MADDQTATASKVTFFGHPIHPILVAFPIAFLVAAFLTDIAFWQTDDFFWARGSLWLIGVGLLTGVFAAIAGVIDFFGIKAAQRSSGWWHFIANVITIALAFLNWVIRLEDPAATIVFFGLVLSALTSAFLVLGSWFGGELTFHYRIGAFGQGNEQE